MNGQIQDSTFAYRLLRKSVGITISHSYKKIQVEGLENIPKDGCTIWAANHTNAMMDPMVLLRITDIPEVYVARADIFRSKPFIVKLLTFLKIMPIYRMRDGINSVKRNDEVIARAADVLSSGVPLVIFPEATHRAKHSLLNLSKGVFHIAFAVNEKVAGQKPVYVQPIGIDYGDYFRYRSTVLVRFGKPVDISAFIRENSDETQPVMMHKLREVLTERMAEVITFVPDDNDYDAIWEYAKLKAGNREYFAQALADSEKAAGRKYKGLEQLQAVNKYAISEALSLRQENPEKAADLFREIDAQRVWRIQHGVSVRSIAGNTKWSNVLLKMLGSLIGLPYYLFSAVVTALVWAPTVFILSKVDDDAFYNTARFGTRLALSWIYVIVFGILFFKFLPVVPAVILTLLLFPAYNYFVDYREFVRMTLSDMRWLLSRRKPVR